MDISLRFESGNKKIEVGKGKAYRLLRVEGLESSQNEIYTTVNAYGDGMRVDNKKIKAKPLLVEAEYQGHDKEGERRKLISFFNLHNKGNVVARVGGVEKSIEYVVENFNSRLINVNNPLSFLISLLCPDPFFKDITEKKVDVSSLIGGFEFPLNIPDTGLELSVRAISYITNIFNQGDVNAPVRIILRSLGTVEKPEVINLTTGEGIKVNRTLLNGDLLEITTDAGSKRVEIIRADGTRENAFNYIDYKSKFFSLPPGDSSIKYGADLGENNLDVTIYYRQRFLGV